MFTEQSGAVTGNRPVGGTDSLGPRPLSLSQGTGRVQLGDSCSWTGPRTRALGHSLPRPAL